ncbi:MAG: YwqG family protein, partial [Maribacter sp.]
YNLLTYPEINHKIFGYSNNIQGEMELECQLVTNGLYCGDGSGFNDPKRKELEKEKNEWKLLLQIDTDDRTGMMWGDSGTLYYWIKQKDLENLNFDNAWFVLQCY